MRCSPDELLGNAREPLGSTRGSWVVTVQPPGWGWWHRHTAVPQEGRSPRSPWLGFSTCALELKHPNCFLCRPRIPVTLNMKMVMPSWSVLCVAGLGGTL